MLKVEKADAWTPTAGVWICRGPELCQPRGKEHLVAGKRTELAILDSDTGYRWAVCEDCKGYFHKQGLIW
jgi:hypothetical protein